MSLSHFISPREAESTQALLASVVLRVMLARTSLVGAAISWSIQSKQSLRWGNDSGKAVEKRVFDQLKVLRDKQYPAGGFLYSIRKDAIRCRDARWSGRVESRWVVLGLSHL